MLTYPHIIRQLTEREKIALLTNLSYMADPALTAKGVPSVRVGELRAALGGSYPSPRGLARSWDPTLMADVSAAVLGEMKRRGIGLTAVPGAASRRSPWGEGMTEDPFLSGELTGGILSGAARAHMPVVMDGYGAEGEQDTPRDAYTFFEEPYCRARSYAPCVGVLAGPCYPFEAHGVGEFALCPVATEEQTVQAIAAGTILWKGSGAALEQALKKYRRMAEGMERGLTATGELEAAEAAGEVLSEEALDRAVDRVLCLAARCAEQGGETTSSEGASHEPSEELIRRAASASVTLLENRPLSSKSAPALPLKSGTRVLVVGDAVTRLGETEITETVRRVGLVPAGVARGYSLSERRSDALAAEAVNAASSCDHILLFMGADGHRCTPSREGAALLPASQRALCVALSRTRIPMTLVLTGDGDWDPAFLSQMPQPPAAILVADASCPLGVETVMEAVAGVRAPEGRLTATLTASRRVFARSPKPRGVFSGYRYYDTAGYGATYPFGHGLTYTAFRYSGLKVEGDKATFTVKNVGERTGVEIAQVYMGIHRSSVLRPRKELVGFVRLELAPGEAQTVSVPISPVAVYDGARGCPVVEKGTYTLYVGASVSDIRLKHTRSWEGEQLPPDGEDPGDYLPSVSNIQTKRYGMEAEKRPMKSSYRNLIFGIASLVLGVGVKLYDIITAADALFLDIVAGLLAVGAVAFFVLEILDRKRRYAALRREMEAADEALFADADTVSVPSAAELFDRDLYVPEDQETDGEGEGKAAVYDHMADVDPTLTFGDAAKDLSALAAARGVTLTESDALRLLSCMAASRLVFLSGVSQERFSTLVSLLGDYFACPAEADAVDGWSCDRDVLVAVDENGEETPRHTLTALESAHREQGTIHVAALSGVDPSALASYFVAFARHGQSPHGGVTVTVCPPARGEGEEAVTYTLPENLWFFLRLSEGTTVGALPDFVTETATLLTLSLEPCVPAEEVREIRPFRYGQMDFLTERAMNAASVGEDTWKRMDRLETYARRYSSFAMTNKLWVALETCLAVRLAGGEPAGAALDGAVAAKLLPAMIPALKGRIPHGEPRLTETLDGIFGEGNMPSCRGLIKETGEL